MNASTRQFGPKSSAICSSRVVIIATSTRAPANTSGTPTAAPNRVQTPASVSICRTTRDRLAPIASRTAISRRRAKPRASSRFAALAAAAARRRPTSDNSIQSGPPNWFLTRENPVRPDSSVTVRPRYLRGDPPERPGPS